MILGTIFGFLGGNKIKLIIGALVIAAIIGFFWLFNQSIKHGIETAKKEGAAEATTQIVEDSHAKYTDNVVKIDKLHTDYEKKIDTINHDAVVSHHEVDTYVVDTTTVDNSATEKWANEQSNKALGDIEEATKKGYSQ